MKMVSGTGNREPGTGSPKLEAAPARARALVMGGSSDEARGGVQAGTGVRDRPPAAEEGPASRTTVVRRYPLRARRAAMNDCTPVAT